MQKIQKILFPIDFSEKFETLLPWVSTFVEKFGATLYVVFVAQDLSEYSTFYAPHTTIQNFQQEALTAAQKKMAAVVQESFSGFRKRTITMPSDDSRILEQSFEHNRISF